jgi:hypothetical protein
LDGRWTGGMLRGGNVVGIEDLYMLRGGNVVYCGSLTLQLFLVAIRLFKK